MVIEICSAVNCSLGFTAGLILDKINWISDNTFRVSTGVAVYAYNGSETKVREDSKWMEV